MKELISCIFLLLFVQQSSGQEMAEDSLKAILQFQRHDKAEVDALVLLGSHHQQPDSAYQYLKDGLYLAKKIGYKKGEADAHFVLRKIYARQGNFARAIQSSLDALAIYQQLPDYVGIASAHGMLQALYREIGDYHKSLFHAFASEQTARKYRVKGVLVFSGHRWEPLMLAEIGQTYILMNQLDSALVYITKAIQQKELFNGTTWEFPIYLLATVLSKKGHHKTALEKYREALGLCVPNGVPWDTLQVYSGMSTLFKNIHRYDSAVHYGRIVVEGWKPPSEFKNLLEASNNLAHAYKARGEFDSAMTYLELSHAIRDSIFSAEKDRDVQRITFDAKLEEEALKAEQVQYKSNVQRNGFIAGSLVLLLISGVLWRSNHHKQKAKANVEKAYDELKATQAQLVQREKMASLGELTAGIAHEIQNPLNFVNNFSAVNKELVSELKYEAQTGNTEEVLSLATVIEGNEEKILYHGKRADNIVKNMLQHSRGGGGERQPVDVNQLVEEHLRLAYHAFKTKNKDFYADLNVSCDWSTGKVHIVPQDIGRVLLNLFNNAFYAVNEKKKIQNQVFVPSVTVNTKRDGNDVVITVRDNGVGIPENVADKIFQPFFTTKPTGDGTGLGLSLSYDIVTKGHGGKLTVIAKEGEGAEFVVRLPA